MSFTKSRLELESEGYILSKTLTALLTRWENEIITPRLTEEIKEYIRGTNQIRKTDDIELGYIYNDKLSYGSRLELAIFVRPHDSPRKVLKHHATILKKDADTGHSVCAIERNAIDRGEELYKKLKEDNMENNKIELKPHPAPNTMNSSNIPDVLSRMHEERNSLLEKLERLVVFINGASRFKELPRKDQALLKKQFKAMLEYYNILNERFESFRTRKIDIGYLRLPLVKLVVTD
jgi:hypothetical protein